MPWFVTIPLVVTASLGIGRLVVEFGGDAIKTLISGIKNFFANLLGLGKEMSEPMVEQFRDKGEPIREREKKTPSQDRGRDQPQPNKDSNTQQQNKNVQETKNNERENNRKSENSQNGRETKIEDDFNPKKEEISDNIKAFVPSNWKNLSQEQKMEAAQSLFNELAKSEELKLNYQIKFASTNQDLGRTDVVDDKNRIITFDLKYIENISKTEDGKEIEIDSSQTAIPLFNALVREASYARQNEILENIKKDPSPRERSCQKAIIANKSNTPTKINISPKKFLNSRVERIEANNVVPYITAKDTDSFERRAIAALQPSERFATMSQAQYFSKLEKAIDEAQTPLSDKVKEQIEDNRKMAYPNLVYQLKKLYDIRDVKNVEREIENCLYQSNPENEKQLDKNGKPINVNFQLLYAVGVYRMQTTKELVGQEFEDPRDKVIQDIIMNHNREIPSMQEKNYERYKGRLEYANITVGEVILENNTQTQEQQNEKQNDNQNKDNEEAIINNGETLTEEESGEGGKGKEDVVGDSDENFTYTDDMESDEFSDLNGADHFVIEEEEAERD